MTIKTTSSNYRNSSERRRSKLIAKKVENEEEEAASFEQFEFVVAQLSGNDDSGKSQSVEIFVHWWAQGCCTLFTELHAGIATVHMYAFFFFRSRREGH